MPTKRTRRTSKRTVIQPHKGDRRYLRRNKAGQFKREVNVGRSLAAVLQEVERFRTAILRGTQLRSSSCRAMSRSLSSLTNSETVVVVRDFDAVIELPFLHPARSLRIRCY